MALNRVVVVTGANQGIGLEVARKACAAGYTTIVACRRKEAGLSAVEELMNANPAGKAHFKQLDITDTASIASFASSMAEEFPDGINILINNAAIAFKGSDPTPFAQQAQPTFNANFFGTVKLTDALLPLIKKATDARVTNVASFTGQLRILRDDSLRAFFTSPETTQADLWEKASDFVSAVESGTHTEQGFPNTCYGTSKLFVIAWT